MDKTAEYVVKNNEDFERTVLERHISDPRFSFLNPWDPFHSYYEAMKRYYRSMLEPLASAETTPVTEAEEVLQKANLQKLSSSGTVSFKLQPSKAKASTAISLQALPCGFEEEASDHDQDEDVDEEEESVSECHDDEQEHPPAKKQRLDENDEIGERVQVSQCWMCVWVVFSPISLVICVLSVEIWLILPSARDALCGLHLG